MWAGDPDKWPMSEQDKVLSSLLEKVNGAIEQAREAVGGAPLFVMEEELVRLLAVGVPEAKFTAADIRDWAATISS